MSKGSGPTRFEPKTCASCGGVFRSWTPARKYCSLACRAKADEARQHRRKHGEPSEIDISPPKGG